MDVVRNFGSSRLFKIRMRIVFCAFVGGCMALPGCALPSPHSESQRGQLMVGGKKADVLCIKRPGQLEVSIIALQSKAHPIDWSKVKIRLGCFPTNFPGGFCYDMPLADLNMVKGHRARATFVFKAKTQVVNDVGDVEVKSVGDPLIFSFPLSHDEVLERFGMRATGDELQELERLRRSKNQDDQDRALELVLCKLTWYEQERAGVPVCPTFVVRSSDPKDVDCFGGHYPPGTCTLDLGWWGIAGAGFLWEDPGANAVFAALKHAGIEMICSGGPGLSWSIPREDFFRARRILIAAKIKGLYVSNVPEFHF